MHDRTRGSLDIVALTLVFEGSLVVAAVLLGWMFQVPPFESISPQYSADYSDGVSLVIGACATAPMLVMLVAIDTAPWGPFRRLRKVVDQRVAPMFQNLSTTEVFIIALLAGIGEEALFRGFLQEAITAASSAGPMTGLMVASVLFGVCHWLTNTYALFAVIMGLLMGGLLLLTGNLLAPISAHVIYDFIAILYLQRTRRSNSQAA